MAGEQPRRLTLMWFRRNRLMLDWQAQRQLMTTFEQDTGHMSKKHRGHVKGGPVTSQTPLPAGGVQMETFLSWTLVRRGLKKQIITPLDAPQEFPGEPRRER